MTDGPETDAGLPAALAGRPFAALLFDMDGTLISSIAATERVWSAWAGRHGLEPARITAVMHGRRAADTIREEGPPGLDLAAESDWIFRAEMADVEGIVATPGAAAFLQALPATRWAVVTSALRPLALRRLAAAGLPEPPCLVAAEDVARGKPAPDGFLLAAHRLGVPPADCLVFEDAPAGLQAAAAAGMTALAVTAFCAAGAGPAAGSIVDFSALRVRSADGAGLRLAAA